MILYYEILFVFKVEKPKKFTFSCVLRVKLNTVVEIIFIVPTTVDKKYIKYSKDVFVFAIENWRVKRE